MSCPSLSVSFLYISVQNLTNLRSLTVFRLKMAQPHSILHKQLSHVQVADFGHPTLIQTTGLGNQIAEFVGMANGKTTVTLIPIWNGVSISDICRLTDDIGDVRKNLFKIQFKIKEDRQLFDFG